MATYQPPHPGAMPMPHHMVNMPSQNTLMAQPGGMPAQMYPGMVPRPGHPHMGQSGPMMPAGVSIGPGGMSGHAMSHLQPTNMFPQMSQAQNFPQNINPQMMNQQQQMILRQRIQHQQQQQQQHQQQQQSTQQQHQNNQGIMLNMGQQMGMNPMPIAMPQGMRGVNLPPHMQAQAAQLQHDQTHARNMHLAMQNAQANNQQIHAGQAPPMRPQASMQGMREHQMGPGQPQHPGQPQGNQIPPQTPQNAQLQRPPRPTPAPQNAQQQQQIPPSTSLPPQQNTQPLQTAPQQQDAPQIPNPQAPRQRTPQNANTPGSTMPGNQPTQRAPQIAGAQNTPAQTAEGSSQAGAQNANEQRLAQQQQQVNHQRQQMAARQMNQINHMNQINQMNQMNLYQQQQQQIQQPQGQTVSKLQHFCQAFNTLSTSPNKTDLESWQAFVGEHFNDDGFFHIQFRNVKNSDVMKSFQISVPVLARYFLAHFLTTGVKRMHVSLGGGNDPAVGDEIPSSISYYYENGTHSVANGAMRAASQGAKLATVEFLNVKYDEFLPRQLLNQIAVADPRLSPEKSKSSKAKMNAARKEAEGPKFVELSRLPGSFGGEFGVPKSMETYLETMESLSYMRPLFEFAVNNLHLKPREALAELIDSYQNKGVSQQPQNGQNMVHLNAGQLQAGHIMYPSFNNPMQSAGLRTPGLTGPHGMPQQQYFSPAQSNLGLPNNGSPHVGGHMPSPMGAMQAPAMVPQHSHQGQSATGSSNASPNVTGKRRRGSVVKTEGNDGEGGGGNAPTAGQNKVKQSPRPGKKQKGIA